MLLGYFFLNLYRAGLHEIKYFQNEIANVMAWRASLRSALALGDRATISAITKRLVETERNFVLKKGETTVDLKREARLAAQDVGWMREVKELFGRSRGEISSKKDRPEKPSQS